MKKNPDEALSPERVAILFQAAYNDHGQKLRYYAMKHLNNPQDAEDIVATLFTNLWAKGPAFNQGKLNWSYLRKAVRNACLDHLIRMARFEFIDPGSTSPESIPSHEEDLIRTEVVAQISEIIDTLPP